MFKKVLYVLAVFVFLTGCTQEAVTQTPTVAHNEFSPVPPSPTAVPEKAYIFCEPEGKEVDLISYERTVDNQLSLVMRERSSGRLVNVIVTIFYYNPLTIKNGVTSFDTTANTLNYFYMTREETYPPGLPGEKFNFPSNSSGTVFCQIGDGFVLMAITGLFSPTENDLYIKRLFDNYRTNRDKKAEMLGARALHNAQWVYPNDPDSEIAYYSIFDNSLRDWDLFVPGTQCWLLTLSYIEWGTDWKQYTNLREMCGFKDSTHVMSDLDVSYRGFAIDYQIYDNKSFGDFNRYYSFPSGMLPDTFNLSYARGEICPGGQVDLPSDMTGTAFESTGWIDLDSGFVFDYGIDFVISFSQQHFFIPYGGFFVVTNTTYTHIEYALFTTCSER